MKRTMLCNALLLFALSLLLTAMVYRRSCDTPAYYLLFFLLCAAALFSLAPVGLRLIGFPLNPWLLTGDALIHAAQVCVGAFLPARQTVSLPIWAALLALALIDCIITSKTFPEKIDKSIHLLSIAEKMPSASAKSKRPDSSLGTAFWLLFPPAVFLGLRIGNPLLFGFAGSCVLALECFLLFLTASKLARRGYMAKEKWYVLFAITVPIYVYILFHLYAHKNDIVYSVLNGVCCANVAVYVGKLYKAHKR